MRTIRKSIAFAALVSCCGCGSQSDVIADRAATVDSGEADDRTAPSTDVSAPDADAATVLADVGPDAAMSPETETGTPPAPLNVLAIGELLVNGQPEIHAPFVQAAKSWLAAQTDLTITFVESPNTITDALLSNYSLILQLNFTPFRWNATAQSAFEKYISEGRGGWVGLHHAGLYGPVVTPASEKPWTWYYYFFGQINYRNYISSFAEATVKVEASSHPIFNGVPAAFQVTTDEWYTWDKSPRPNVRVLANVDENSYKPPSAIKMGDHPVVWTNEAYRGRNLYIFMGHHPNLFQNSAYMTLLRNAILWAGTPVR
jgi:type 1 glutamine amidotransferase